MGHVARARRALSPSAPVRTAPLPRFWGPLAAPRGAAVFLDYWLASAGEYLPGVTLVRRGLRMAGLDRLTVPVNLLDERVVVATKLESERAEAAPSGLVMPIQTAQGTFQAAGVRLRKGFAAWTLLAPQRPGGAAAAAAGSPAGPCQDRAPVASMARPARRACCEPSSMMRRLSSCFRPRTITTPSWWPGWPNRCSVGRPTSCWAAGSVGP